MKRGRTQKKSCGFPNISLTYDVISLCDLIPPYQAQEKLSPSTVEQTRRHPTHQAIVVQHSRTLSRIGRIPLEQQASYLYNLADSFWCLTPKLPLGALLVGRNEKYHGNLILNPVGNPMKNMGSRLNKELVKLNMPLLFLFLAFLEV